MLSEVRHTRIVRLAKVVLPLAALVLLSTIFLISDRVDPTRAPLYSEVDLDRIAREQRIGAPHYSGVTQDGDALKVEATAAYPDLNGTTGTRATDMKAHLVSPTTGETTDMTARSGLIDPARTEIALTGDVTLKTSTGYDLATGEARIATDRSRISLPGAVDGRAPYGTLSSDSAEMSRPAAGAPYDLVFTGGVKLVYQPH